MQFHFRIADNAFIQVTSAKYLLHRERKGWDAWKERPIAVPYPMTFRLLKDGCPPGKAASEDKLVYRSYINPVDSSKASVASNS